MQSEFVQVVIKDINKSLNGKVFSVLN